jgi:hypothetical protein
MKLGIFDALGHFFWSFGKPTAVQQGLHFHATLPLRMELDFAHRWAVLSPSHMERYNAEGKKIRVLCMNCCKCVAGTCNARAAYFFLNPLQ